MILRSDQVSSDCIVVDERAHNDVDVPDGVGQGDDPITLEEYHAKLQISICLGNSLNSVIKTLPKALRTQALTALTSNFGSVGLVQYAW